MTTRARHSAAFSFATAALLAASSRAGAAGVEAPSGHGQQALAVRVSLGEIRARACASDPCSADGGSVLAVPDDVRPLLGGAAATRIELLGGRQLVRVEIASAAAPPGGLAAAWVMLIAAPLTGKGTEPHVVWSGWTGVVTGEHGEGRSAAVMEERTIAHASKKAATRVLVGERRDDVTVCGRPTLVAAKEVDPETLELARGATVQNLSTDERAKATKLVATRAAGATPTAPVARLLRATAASSAVDKKLDTLTDGNVDTTWAENKAGDGAGEFVRMASADEVSITAFDLVVKGGTDAEGSVAPRTFFLATTDRLFHVTMPEDAWKQPVGTRYTVKLPEGLKTSCVALVLGEPYAARGAARVTLAEIEARTAFDGMSADALAGALAGGGDLAQAAAALLARGGPAAVRATIARYDTLDAAGKQLANAIIDTGSCDEQVPFFAARFAALSAVEVRSPEGRAIPGAVAEPDPALAHARDRLRRCGRGAAPALAKLVAEGTGRARLRAADELALVAPAEAITVLLDALAKVDGPTRRDLRAALAIAAKSPRASSALEEEIGPAKWGARPLLVQIDLLRAIGPSLGRVKGSRPAFAAVVAALPSSTDEAFRGRYLLQAPAAELASAGDESALAFARSSLRRDGDAHVRLRAAQTAGKVAALHDDLVAAVDDADVRVRQAAIASLAASPSPGATPPKGLADALGRRLATDDWPFVRSGAARGLGALPADAAMDRVLAAALDDASPEVRGQAVDALGTHRAVTYAEVVRERAENADELPEVRARAILALAAMCDARSVDDWTKRALRAKSPADEVERRLGTAAIAALGALHPADLGERLAALLDKDAPPPVREMARVALASESRCKR